MTDPEIEYNDLEAYACWAFNVDRDKLEDTEPKEMKQLIERLKCGNIKRAGIRSA